MTGALPVLALLMVMMAVAIGLGGRSPARAASRLGPGPSAAAAGTKHEPLTLSVDLADRIGASEILTVPAITPVVLLPSPGEALATLPAGLSDKALYGTIRHGGADGVLSVIIDPLADGGERVYVDRDDDEDMAEEPALHWQGEYAVSSSGAAILPSLEVDCQLTCGTEPVPIHLRLQRFERRLVKGQTRTGMRNGILADVESYRQGELAIGDRRMQIALVPTAMAGRYTLFTHPSNALVLDLNGDGKLDGRPLGSPERQRLGAPIRIGDLAFKVSETACDGRHLTLVELDPRIAAMPRQPGSGPLPGDPAPDFALPTIDGDSLHLSDYRGKLVLLDFWATWCGPCRIELPYVKRAYQLYHNRGLEIIGVSLDNSAATVEAFTRANDMPWPQIIQGRGAWTALKATYNVRAIPLAYLIAPDGRVIASQLRGARLLEAIVEALPADADRSD